MLGLHSILRYIQIIIKNTHMKKVKFKCIKGIADSENINVIAMLGDVVNVIEVSEGDILVEGIGGWCDGVELNFTPKQFVEHFESIGFTYVL